MIEYWNDFYISHQGIINNEDESPYLWTYLRDNKTGYNVVEIATEVRGKTIEFYIGTNEKMLKRLKLPTYKHYSDFSYR